VVPTRATARSGPRAEVLGIVPIEVTDALLDTFGRLAERPDRGFLVEQVLEVINP